MISNVVRQVQRWVWGTEPEELPAPRRWAVIVARLVYTLVQDVVDGQFTLRAMGLVYTTLLSLVPLLAIGFSLFKAFGIHNALRPVLLEFLAPLGEEAARVTDLIIGFVENIRVGVLSVVGLALLLYTVISLIQKVEDGCNYIWQVRRPRSIGRRFSEYLSVLIVGPLIVLAAVSITASVTSHAIVREIAEIEPFGTTLILIGKLVPYFLYAAGFTFLFMFMPNAKVRLLPAFAGGLFAGVLWQTASLVFASFVSETGNINAIYSSFAIMIFLLIWIYVSWLIMLLGCHVAFLLQHPEQLRRGRYPPRAGAATEETLALLIMTLVAYNYIHGQPPWPADRLAKYLRAVPTHVYAVIDRLLAARILVETDQDGEAVLPRRDIDRLTVEEVLAVVRSGAAESEPQERNDAPHRRVADVLKRLDRARDKALGGMTIRQLADDLDGQHL